jgi:hypothetical protein
VGTGTRGRTEAFGQRRMLAALAPTPGRSSRPSPTAQLTHPTEPKPLALPVDEPLILVLGFAPAHQEPYAHWRPQERRAHNGPFSNLGKGVRGAAAGVAGTRTPVVTR